MTMQAANTTHDIGGHREATRAATFKLTAILAFALVLASIVEWPVVRRFTFIAFEDRGENLIVNHFLSEGLMPGTGFHYAYGLVPLLVTRAWFAVLGATPGAEFALTSVCNLLIVWGLAKFAVTIRAPLTARAVLVLAVPLIVRIAYLNVTHAIEAALLVHAFAEQARGRLRTALAIVTVCALVKPTMAYVYGLVLIILIMRILLTMKPAATLGDWRRELGPAIIVGASLIALSAGFFGWRPLFDVQIPLVGGRAYHLMNYGFFHGRGRDFWRPGGARLGYYLGTFAGTWLVCTAALLVGGLYAVFRRIRKRASAGSRDKLIAVALTLHLSFICFFYGVSWDWINYANILMLGVIAMICRGRSSALVGGVLVALLLVANIRSLPDKLARFRTFRPSTETAGLWATESERGEWRHVQDLTRGRHPVIFKMSGCAELLFPDIEGTESAYVLGPLLSLLSTAEVERIRVHLSERRDVVVVHDVRTVVELPPFQQAMAGKSLLWRGQLFDVYRPKDEPQGAPPG